MRASCVTEIHVNIVNLDVHTHTLSVQKCLKPLQDTCIDAIYSYKNTYARF